MTAALWTKLLPKARVHWTELLLRCDDSTVSNVIVPAVSCNTVRFGLHAFHCVEHYFFFYSPAGATHTGKHTLPLLQQIRLSVKWLTSSQAGNVSQLSRSDLVASEGAFAWAHTCLQNTTPWPVPFVLLPPWFNGVTRVNPATDC